MAMIELNSYADCNNIIQVTKLSSEHDHVSSNYPLSDRWV